MTTFTLRHFSNAETLQAIRPSRLLELLTPHADYFATRGVRLDTGVDVEAIAEVLMTPDALVPSTLADDLYFVDEMASVEMMDTLLASADLAGLPLDLSAESSAADIAVQLRLLAPEFLEQKHAEHCLLSRRRTFEYYQSEAHADPTYEVPTPVRIARFEQALAASLKNMLRGCVCKLYIFHKEDGVWFLIRRGDPFKREGALLDTLEAHSVYYRPERYDVLRYDERLGELSINSSGSKGLVAHYRQLMGQLLFDDPERFPHAAKYTLEPLLDQGEAALICTDVDGIEHITLKEVHEFFGGAYSEIEIHRASDVFAALRDRDEQLEGRLVRASFVVKFPDSRTPRVVTIRGQNIASYTRDGDACLVEQWLERRGFVLSQEALHADFAPTLAVA